MARNQEMYFNNGCYNMSFQHAESIVSQILISANVLPIGKLFTVLNVGQFKLQCIFKSKTVPFNIKHYYLGKVRYQAIK